MKAMKMMIFAVALLVALAVTPTYALEYAVDGPSAGEFGTPTSSTTVYIKIGLILAISTSMACRVITIG